MSPKKFLSAIAILALMLFMVGALANSAKAQAPYPLDSMWVAPTNLTLTTNNATVGTLFNMTVWAYCENGTYDWQVTLNFSAAVFQCIEAGYSAGATSAYLAGHVTIPITPVIDNFAGSVLFGESLLGATDYLPQNDTTLMYAEFNVTSMATSANPKISGLFDINATGGQGTFFENASGTVVPDSNIYDASFTMLYTPLPTISDWSQTPITSQVNDSESVAVSANVTDNSGTGISNVTLVYSTDGFTTNSTAAMTLNSTTGLYEGTIPGYPGGTVVSYAIDVYDNAAGFIEYAPPGVPYTVVPEYVALSLLLIMVAMLAVAITIARKKHHN